MFARPTGDRTVKVTLPSPGPSPPAADAVTWEESPTFTPRFGEDGLIPCITVDAPTGGVLMMAWMNAEALRLSLETGFVHYWSRSRQMLWKKGESSGAIQRIVDLRTDCDQDVVLVRVAVNDPSGTCHTGRPTCFYRSVPLGPGPLERSFEPADGGES